MSYLLDALQKATAGDLSEPAVKSEDLQQLLATKEPENVTHNKLHKVVVYYFLLAFAFTIGGFVLGDGAEVLVNYYHSFEEKEVVGKIEFKDEPLIPFYGAADESSKYFAKPNEYNHQLVALKIEQAEQEQQRLIAKQQAEEQADEQAKKQLMEQQIQNLLNQANIQQALAVNKAENLSSVNEEVKDTPPPVKLSLNKDELSDVSPDLLQAFEEALDDTNNPFIENTPTEPKVRSASNIKPLAQMPQWLQKEMPSLHFSLHMYTSDATSSWVRLNDQDYYTGDLTKDGLVIEEIQPQLVVLQYQGYRFSLPALSSW